MRGFSSTVGMGNLSAVSGGVFTFHGNRTLMPSRSCLRSLMGDGDLVGHNLFHGDAGLGCFCCSFSCTAERVLVSLERVQFGGFWALEAVVLADL